MSLEWKIETDYPVAFESLDYLHPFGTIRDNNTNQEFINKLNKVSPSCVLDIGCAGGAFVKNLIDLGYEAIGIEGCDINFKTKRAEWATIPNNLFTADATKPFRLKYKSKKYLPDNFVLATFNVVTAWEFFEHIKKEDLAGVMNNINNHTYTGSMLVCSVANFPSPHEGVDLHETQEGPEFWLPFFKEYGWERSLYYENYFHPDWVRIGTYNWVFERE